MASGDKVPALGVKGVSVHFGGLAALSNVNLTVQAGTCHGILGANGAGKTTLFNAITGFIIPDSGSVSIFGKTVTRMAPHRRVGLGLARTFQITTLFPDLTTLENVLMGALVTVGHHRNFWRSARVDEDALELAEALLDELNLAHLGHVPVREVGYGEQRLLEIAVTSALKPRILLLDEPTAGLSAAETSAVLEVIRRLPADLTVVIIEHDLDVIFEVAEHLTVLHFGENIADGPAQVVREDPVVKEVYTGGR
jgi:ABC-type branched-subunit amino acid transport system ATPase component